MSGFPMRTYVGPADADAANCRAFGLGLEVAVSGQDSYFSVQTFDRYGNHLQAGGEVPGPMSGHMSIHMPNAHACTLA